MEFPERIITRLNDPSEYRHIPDDNRLHVVHRFDKQGRRSMVLGSRHNTNASHNYYDWAFSCFELWEERTAHENRIMVAEGEQDLWGVAPTLQTSVEHHYSEVGWQCFLADTYDIPIISGEPANYGEIAQLAKDGSYPPDELLLYYGIREIPLWHRGERKEDFDSYMERVFDIYQRKLGRLAITHSLEGIDFTYPRFLEAYKQHFDNVPDPTSREMNDLYLKFTSAELAEAAFSKQAIARVAKRVMNLRDAHLGATYNKYRQKDFSIFSWYGINHTLALAKYLQSFGTPQPLPGRFVSAFSFQGGEIIEGSNSPRNGPAKIQAAAYKIFAERPEQSVVWPKWLRPIKSPLDAAYVKQHYKNRTLIFRDVPYINPYLVRPTKLWNPDFFMLSNHLEKTVEQELDPLIEKDCLDPTWERFDMFRKMFSLLDNPGILPDEKLAHIALRRLLWAFETSPRDHSEFMNRIEELRRVLYSTALHEGYEEHHAVLAFDTASKHLVAIRHNLKNILAAKLTPAEHLQYALDVLDHLLYSKGLDGIIDKLTM